MSGLLRRIQSLENAVAALGRRDDDDEPEWVKTVMAMGEEEIDQVLKNLLVAGGPPDDPALAAIWTRAIAEGVDALGDEEFRALHEWIMTT
jgi:hypothetical protein